jgi:hypothetical protein
MKSIKVPQWNLYPTVLVFLLALAFALTPCVASAQFLNDTFTEASDLTLASHTPETGGTWTKHPSYTDTITVDSTSDFIYGDATDVGTYYNTASPANANYYVQAGIFVVNNASPSYPGVIGRVNTAANTMYRAFYHQGLGTWYLQKLVAGTTTDLGTYVQALTNSQTYTLRLEMNGTTIRMLIDGVERANVTDASIAATGKAGVIQQANSGQQVTSVTAANLGGGGGATCQSRTLLGVGC